MPSSSQEIMLGGPRGSDLADAAYRAQDGDTTWICAPDGTRMAAIVSLDRARSTLDEGTISDTALHKIALMFAKLAGRDQHVCDDISWWTGTSADAGSIETWLRSS